MSIRRLSLLARHISPRTENRTFAITTRTKIDINTKDKTLPFRNRGFATVIRNKMDINTKYKVLSGYEIPALGYGVGPIEFNNFLSYDAGNIAAPL